MAAIEQLFSARLAHVCWVKGKVVKKKKKKNPKNELLCLHFISSLSTGFGVRK